MLSGKGSQAWMTKTFEERRRKALKNRYPFSDEELIDLEIEFGEGGGRTNPNTFKIRQFPFPTKGKRDVIDIRDLPWIGD